MKMQTKKRGNPYLALTRGGMMEQLAFQNSMLVRVIANLFYLILIYFLWRAIYDSSPSEVVNGMTFYDTMVYLVLASAMFQFMEMFVIWNIGDDYQSGRIVSYLTKPFDYQAYMFWNLSGNVVISFVFTFLPTFVVVCVVAHTALHFGSNLLLFFVSLLFATVLNFFIDFTVGLICFYTESVWGVNIMKEVIVSLLSGATIPLAFFPKTLRRIVDFLPFQAIYNTPLQILTDQKLALAGSLRLLLWQLVWLAVVLAVSRIFWKAAKRRLTVNGG